MDLADRHSIGPQALCPDDLQQRQVRIGLGRIADLKARILYQLLHVAAALPQERLVINIERAAICLDERIRVAMTEESRLGSEVAKDGLHRDLVSPPEFLLEKNADTQEQPA
jgi:hypothetical protein